MVRRGWRPMVVLGVLLAACSGDGDEAPSEALTFRSTQPGPFAEAPARAPAGEVTLRLVNEDAVGHSLRIEQLDDGLELVPGGEEATATVSFEPDMVYTYYCDVAGHRELGMEGQLRTGT